MSISSFETLFLTCLFILPGFIINTIDSAINPNEKCNDFSLFLRYLTYSIINFIMSYVFINIFYRAHFVNIFTLTIIFVLFAVIIGTAISFVKQKYPIHHIFNAKHPIPTAWDYYFSQQCPSYILVTLVDGTKIAGWYSSNSFSSSVDNERDLYIEKKYDETGEEWTPVENNNGIYIAKNQIRTIEFLKGADIIGNG